MNVGFIGLGVMGGRMAATLARAGHSLAVHDVDRAKVDALAAAAHHAGAQYFGGGPLFLMPSAKKIFFPFLEERFPKLAESYWKLYAGGAYLGGEYKAQLRELVARIRERHGLGSAPVEYRPELWEGEEQGTLFPLH